jgi:hypothetical protein
MRTGPEADADAQQHAGLALAVSQQPFESVEFIF